MDRTKGSCLMYGRCIQVGVIPVIRARWKSWIKTFWMWRIPFMANLKSKVGLATILS